MYTLDYIKQTSMNLIRLAAATSHNLFILSKNSNTDKKVLEIAKLEAMEASEKLENFRSIFG